MRRIQAFVLCLLLLTTSGCRVLRTVGEIAFAGAFVVGSAYLEHELDHLGDDGHHGHHGRNHCRRGR